ncbi:hypothetical protein R3P38DRAFT_1625990 [Favolaschia claudopus]|uniref:F-box domain-containing protein n=1 Tax=Favolaschia claudopus TaxID=2862362 RepID=A0AAW0AHB0_9AGAR
MSVSPSTTDSLVLSSSSRGAREHCLQNLDLLEEIIQHIGGGSSAKINDLRRDRHSLLQVALTCRALSPSATKFLWRSLGNLLPLLQLLPSFTERNGTYYLLGAITPPEWDKFDYYAAYVQEIRDESFPDDAKVEPSVYLQLAIRKAPILPNLRRIKYMSASGCSPYQVLLYALSPLREVEMRGAPDSEAGFDTATMGEVIFTALGSANSRITTLVLTGQLYTILSDHITLDRLESLTLEDMKGTIDTSVVRWIGSIPTLLSLTLRIREQDSWDQKFLSSRGLFKALLHLQLEGRTDPNSGRLFLRLISSEILQTLKMHPAWLRPDASKEIVYIQRVIAQWSKSLCDLELSLSGATMSRGDQIDLKGLFGHLHRLRHLNFLLIAQIPDAGELLSSLYSLPHLETLELSITFPAGLGMDLVTQLAQHCPKLQFLQIPLAITQLSLFSTTPVSEHNLKTLVIFPTPDPLLNDQPSSLVDVVNVARHLDRLFPRLTAVRYYLPERFGSQENETWENVQELVFAFQDVRRCTKIQQTGVDMHRRTASLVSE